MPNILCIDASTEACSAALLTDNEQFSRYQVVPRQHAQLLLPFVDDVLTQAGLTLKQLDAIACHVGPGAFTGIRIGVSVAQGLAFGANIPTIAISSLASMANSVMAQSGECQLVLAAIDARMGEIYFGIYLQSNHGLATLLGDEIVVAPNQLDLEAKLADLDFNLGSAKLVGSGWQAYPEALKQQTHALGIDWETALVCDQFPNAKYSLALAQEAFNSGLVSEPEALQPVYLRNNVAHKKTVKK
ncbi:tRNA (adenosine(37)-N6)-threonylcarbamoyltransferase complex dimerization subunit type 1 TsaB [Aliikangiella sp. IMCC44653]